MKEEYGVKNIEAEKISSIFDSYKSKVPEVMYFFCQDCEKNICEGCKSFLHRNHDVTFVSKDKGVCVHEINDKQHKPKTHHDNPNEGRVRKPERFVPGRYMNG